jgi:recombinational DNA repair ATPase RecF
MKADSQSKKAKVLAEAFDSAQKAVLGSLYTDIENDFVDNYHTLHDNEKDSFKARIRPEGAGVQMRVDFFGRGTFPPHALHSEGHQDSMGLCLFLALMSKLSGNHVGFTVLDDVVMSVDVDHRRAICDLLLKKFPNRQFFITTHDKAWARHLEKTTVVARQNVLSFRGWTVETGPRWKREDLWAQIRELLQGDNIPSAASALRRELEEMFD